MFSELSEAKLCFFNIDFLAVLFDATGKADGRMTPKPHFKYTENTGGPRARRGGAGEQRAAPQGGEAPAEAGVSSAAAPDPAVFWRSADDIPDSILARWEWLWASVRSSSLIQSIQT